MNSKMLFNTFEEQLFLVRQILKRYYKSYDAEDLHKLRVQIKRLEALLKLPQFVDALKGNLQIKKLFHQSGKIREWQVMLKLFARSGRYDLVPDFICFVEKKIDRCEQNFVARKNHNIKLLDGVIKSEHKFHAEVSREQFLDYHKNLATEICKEFSEDNRNMNLHEVRKKVKELMYNIELLNVSETRMLKKLIRINKLDELQELLGNWHDNTFLISILKSAEQSEQLVSIIKKLQTQTRLLRKEINNACSQLCVVKSNGQK